MNKKVLKGGAIIAATLMLGAAVVGCNGKETGWRSLHCKEPQRND